MNVRLCKANRTNGEPCKAPAMKGQLVCRVHGGAAPQARDKAKQRILEAVDPILAEMARIAQHGKTERDRITAGKVLLDYAGIASLIAEGMTDKDIQQVVEWPDRRW